LEHVSRTTFAQLMNSPLLSIRPTSATDILTIQALAHRTWPHTFGGILSAEQITYMLEWMYSPAALEDQMARGHQFFLAQTPGGEPLGYASWQDLGGARARLHKIYVVPEAQGTGAGRALMEAVETAARAAGCTALELNVNRENRAADFYERGGFQTVRTKDIDIGNGYWMNDWVMEKALG